jgi:hypothetical protein
VLGETVIVPALFRRGVGVTAGVGVKVGADTLDVVDDDPFGMCVAVAVLGGGEVAVVAGRTVTCGATSSGVSDPAAADSSDATKVDVVAVAGALALL